MSIFNRFIHWVEPNIIAIVAAILFIGAIVLGKLWILSISTMLFAGAVTLDLIKVHKNIK